MESIKKNEFKSKVKSTENKEHPVIVMENDVVYFQQTCKEHSKDVNYDSKKKDSCYQILENMKKYCCNINQVDSFNFNDGYNNFLREEKHTNADINSLKDKLKQKSNNNFLCYENFNKNQINHKDDNDYLKLTSEFKNEYKDIYGKSYNKNEISNFVYSCKKPTQAIKKNGYYNKNAPYIYNERKDPNENMSTNYRNIYGENGKKHLGVSKFDENVRTHIFNNYINQKYIKNKSKNRLKKKSFEYLNNIYTEKNGYFKNNKKIYKEKDSCIYKKRNDDNEEIYIYNLTKDSDNYTFKERNETQNEIILNKYKTSLHTNNDTNENIKLEHVLKNSFLSHDDKNSENEINSSPLSINKKNKIKQVNLNIELLNIDKDINLMLSNGILTNEKNNRNTNNSMASLSQLEKKKKPLLVDNFSQTIRKKKKFTKIGRLKISRKIKRKKKFRLKEKIPHKNELKFKKKKTSKSKYVKNKTNKNPKKNTSNNKKKKNIKIIRHSIYGKKIKKNNFSSGCSDIYSKKLVNIKQGKGISSKVLEIENTILPQFNTFNEDNNSVYSSNEEKNRYLNIEKCSDKTSKKHEEIKSCNIENFNKIHNSTSKSIKNIEVDDLKVYNANKKFTEQKLSNICKMNSNISIKENNMKNACNNKLPRKNFTSMNNSNLNNKENNSLYKAITFEHINSELIKESFIDSKDKHYTLNEVKATHTNVKNENKKCNCINKNKRNINIKLKCNNPEFFNISQRHVENDANFKPLNNISLTTYKKKLSDMVNKFNNNSLLNESNKFSSFQSKIKKNTYEKNNYKTIMILQEVASILNEEKANLYSYNLDEKTNKKDNSKMSNNLSEILSTNLKFPGCEKYNFYGKEIKKKCIKNKSYDSFFNEKFFNKNLEYINLIKTFLSKKKNLKDNNNLLFHKNLLQQRSLFMNQMTYENHVDYILNSIIFYSNKLKNILNHSIKRRNDNEYALEVKFLFFVLFIIEKHKINTFKVSIEKVSKLIRKIIEKIRFYILYFPKVVKMTKFESAIIKIYFIELLKMSRLLCSIGQKKLRKQFFFNSSSFTEDLILKDKVEMQEDSLTNMIPIKREINILNNLNSEFSDEKNLKICYSSLSEEKVANALFEEGKNRSNTIDRKNSEKADNIELKKSNDLNENKYNEDDLKGINIICNNENNILNIKNNFNLEENNIKNINEKRNNNLKDINALIKKSKKDILTLQRKNYDKVYNLMLLMKYLDKLCYIYKINNALFCVGENQKNLINETKKMLENINEETLREKSEAFYMETLTSIKKIKKKLEEHIFSFLNTSFEKNSHLPSNILKYNDDTYLEKELSLLNKKIFNKNYNENEIFMKENNNVNPENCVYKKKLVSCRNSKQVLSEKSDNYNIDETKELQELNDYLNIIILNKDEEILKNPNDYYGILKKCNQELSLINEMQRSDNNLTKDFLDSMNIYKFSKLLNFYVKKKYFNNKFSEQHSFNNLEMYQKNNGILQILYDFYMENEKDIFKINKNRSFFKNLHSIKKINKNIYHSFSNEKILDDNKHFPYVTSRSYNEIKFSRSKSTEFNENDNIKYFKIYS
ncbi:conserved Plasmodium protein, unknown function [Plasmodium gallinaceum]|uniref:Uncharacterized protein n=1 Tax=Plasmodium gallinaceum TaxID=5849 RepID=A0A1J1GWA8_PLAGA|nr:LOW QUALITY PROTEIN: conserved Plasmodium protein, unknown function [Plasmodium gallinaceum]CRG96723.1 conserved Plasmodium protein, unknown function [Plasmodium gallinaceum]